MLLQLFTRALYIHAVESLIYALQEKPPLGTPPENNSLY